MTKQKWLAALTKDRMVSKDENPIPALLICAILEVGADKERCAKWLGVVPKDISSYWANLAASGVVVRGCQNLHADFSDPKMSGIEFALLINVALGRLKRVVGKPKRKADALNKQGR